jgi:methionyl-tRNA formyltransferase
MARRGRPDVIIAFAGTPAFARVALDHLERAGHAIALVLSQPDRPAGRGLHLQPSPVAAWARERRLPLVQPRSLRLDGRFPDDADAARSALIAARPDVLVVAAYGLILPRWVLELPRHGCLNIHASLLPRWRGAAPIQRAIEAGDRQTGITIMQMDEGLDTGPMLLSDAMPVDAGDTAGSLQGRLAQLGGRLVVRALAALDAGTLVGQAQPAEGVTYAAKIGKEEAPIDWRLPAAVIERRLRAFDPFPGATASLGGQALKCWRAHVAPAGTGAPGQVVAVGPTGLRVACGEGALDLIELQRAGGRRLPVREFLQRGGVEPGMGFELPPARIAPQLAATPGLPPATL